MEEVQCKLKLGILIKVDSQEIFEGVWESNSLRWGLKVGRINE